MARIAALTEREVEVLLLVAKGLTDREIADRLRIARGTVSNHMSVILLKLGAARRAQAVSQGFRLGLIGDGGGVLQGESYRIDEAAGRHR